jgi:hypothetical protein
MNAGQNGNAQKNGPMKESKSSGAEYNRLKEFRCSVFKYVRPTCAFVNSEQSNKIAI